MGVGVSRCNGVYVLENLIPHSAPRLRLIYKRYDPGHDTTWGIIDTSSAIPNIRTYNDEVEISPSEPEVITVELHEEEAEKKTKVTLEKIEEQEEESKEDQPLVLVKQPTLPRILVEF
ncbi:hypothetical protein Scep_007075 [Stephania cephalantha]|uniref:Uncharacterized protein n=1 Tax=Stephania cephalantha TaxID=152367 RepID=A0AAP0K926_9MAGN